MEEQNINLIEAIHAGDVKNVESLLVAGVNPNFTIDIQYDTFGETDHVNFSPVNEAVTVALKYAEEVPERSKRRSVFNHESKIPDTVSIPALKEIICLLFLNGADPNEVSLLNVLDECRDDVLCEEFIRMLIENGVGNYTEQRWGNYFLMQLIEKFGTEGLLDFLIAHELDLNKPIDESGLRLIHIVSEKGSEKDVEGLIKKGVNINVSLSESHGNTGYIKHDTPLLISLKNKYGGSENALVLLSHGADPNIENEYGQTPLSMADRNGFDDVVQKIEELLA